ncbi:MAG: GAF domain-containing sensor histidine kinase [Chloroflexi bacterium]|nr:GAF domain-containing sensor histidine kinase [Chloroflexota bacterium]
MVTLTREQLEERLAALHRASLELVRDLSRNTVLERIVKLARQQVGARYAAIGMVNSKGELERFIPVGMSNEMTELMAHPPKGLGLIGALREEQQTIRVADISADPRSAGFPSSHPPMCSFLGVPIMSGGRLLGQIYLTDKEDAPEFTDDDERVIETLAAYAAVAIENARLYERVLRRDDTLAQRNEDLSVLNDLANTLAGSLEVGEILEQTLNRVIDYLGVEAGEIFLREEGRKELRLALHRGEAAEAFWSRERFMVGEYFIGRVALLGQTLVSTSLETDVRLLRKAIVDAGFRCLACIPLMARRKVVGVMTVASRQERQFDERVLNLLEAIGAWTGTAIENARLHNQAGRLAVLEERERIGMDLHDGIIQSIYGVGLALEYAQLSIDENTELAREKINQSIEGLNSTIRDIRSYVLDLRPRQLRDEQPLKQGLQRLIDEFRTHSLASATLTAGDDGLANLPRENRLALFHICQEALANVAKHAHARQTNVHLWTSDERVLLEITDDGRGFDLQETNAALGHGLSNMRRRARKVGGEVEIESQSMGGTTILAWVPWDEIAPPEASPIPSPMVETIV